MRLFELEEDCNKQTILDHLRTPLSEVPPLATLSVSSADNETSDDSSSVSSVSLEEEAWDLVNQTAGAAPAPRVPAKRSIFASYWTKKGGRPQEPLRLPEDSDDDISSSSSCSALSSSSYEKLLEKNEAPAVKAGDEDSSKCAAGAGGGPRRRLWDNRYVSQSASSLPECARVGGGFATTLTMEPLRKTQSASAVVGGPGRSCLRECRYSGSSSRRRSSSSSSSSSTSRVSFNEQVQVQFLKPVAERHAEKGWSKYFM